MATAVGDANPVVVEPGWLDRLPRNSVAERLVSQPFLFDFFQAVRLLNQLAAGRPGAPREAVRFRVWNTLAFPSCTVRELDLPQGPGGQAALEVAFIGLTGPSGVMPRHYTEILLRQERDTRKPERYALRDWFDLYNDRVIGLFYKAWEKYRFYLPTDRRSWTGAGTPFTSALFGVVGLGLPSLRGRLRVAERPARSDAPPRELARVDDLVLLYYGGLFATRHRTADGLAAALEDYFDMPTRVLQFQGSWLRLGRETQTRLGPAGGSNELGVDAVAGDRVWDVQGKVRVRLGPMPLERFRRLLPDRSRTPHQKEFFRLVHLARLYLGPEFDFDVQLILEAEDVPELQMPVGTGEGPRLGWDSWLRSSTPGRPTEDAVFAGEVVSRL